MRLHCTRSSPKEECSGRNRCRWKRSNHDFQTTMCSISSSGVSLICVSGLSIFESSVQAGSGERSRTLADPTSEAVRQPTAEGVADVCELSFTHCCLRDKNLRARSFGMYSTLADMLFRFIHRSILAGSTSTSRTLNTSSGRLAARSFLCCLFLTIACIS
jgi:hypothetical protein